ncbi:MAG: outer membrane protein assembly factor BamA [Desulfobacteraceae bacterium]|nr:outer membrane protein assembly factor BamA [Desulfobacteraceae bacterium]
MIQEMAIVRNKLLIPCGILLTCLLFAPLPFSVQAEPQPSDPPESVALDQPIADLHITIVDSSEDAPAWEKAASSLISIDVGTRLTTEIIENAIDALKQSGKFRHIHVDTGPVSGGVRLLFSLTPYKLIKDIRIRGNYPLFDRDVLNVLSVVPGDVFIETQVPRQQELVTELYRRDGYIDPQVSVEAVRDDQDGHYTLIVGIEKGDYYHVSSIGISGNRLFSDDILKGKMKILGISNAISNGRRFTVSKLSEDIKKLTAYYRREGFAEILITQAVTYSKDRGTVDIRLSISEGPKYKIEWKGNKTFSDRQLKGELVIFTEGNVNNIGLRKSLRNIRSRYEQSGFQKAKIDATSTLLEASPTPLHQILIHIAEGSQTMVESVEVTGNEYFTAKRIDDQILTGRKGFFTGAYYVSATLEADLLAIKTMYEAHGFLDAEIHSNETVAPDRQDVRIRIDIKEGPRTLVSSVSIDPELSISIEPIKQALALQAGKPFSPAGFQNDRDALAAMISEKGYPHADIAGSTKFSDDRRQVDLSYTVDLGPQVKIGNIMLNGNMRTRDSNILRELNIRTGEPLSMQRILDGRRNLRNMNTFRSVDVDTTGLKEKDESVHLWVAVEEKKPYFFEVGAGYESDRGALVRTKAGDRNLLGRNKDIWISSELSEVGYRTESVLSDPKLLGTRISADLSVFMERLSEFNQSFGTETMGASINFNRPLSRFLTANLGFRFERRDQFALEVTDIRDEQLEPREILVTTPSIRYDSRDSFVRPTRGAYAAVDLDVSRGIQNSLDDFTKYRFETRLYYTPADRLTFALMGRAGFLVPYGSRSDISSDQLFYLGGTNDVRGFEENLLQFDENLDPAGGRQFFSGSLESRIDVGRNVELMFFYDTGRISDLETGVEQDEFRSSIGAGLRYHTPIGPIGILYGSKLNPRDDESPGRLHFSIGYTF